MKIFPTIYRQSLPTRSPFDEEGGGMNRLTWIGGIEIGFGLASILWGWPVCFPMKKQIARLEAERDSLKTVINPLWPYERIMEKIKRKEDLTFWEQDSFFQYGRIIRAEMLRRKLKAEGLWPPDTLDSVRLPNIKVGLRSEKRKFIPMQECSILVKVYTGKRSCRWGRELPSEELNSLLEIYRGDIPDSARSEEHTS